MLSNREKLDREFDMKLCKGRSDVISNLLGDTEDENGCAGYGGSVEGSPW